MDKFINFQEVITGYNLRITPGPDEEIPQQHG